MKPWIKRTLFGLFGVAIIAGGLSACGHGHHEHGMVISEEDSARFRAKMVERVGKELELTEPQKQRLVVLGERLRDQRVALIGKTIDPRADARSLLAGAQFDKARAQAILDEKTAAIRGKSPEVITAAAEYFDSLSPAQQQKVRDFLEGRRGWFSHG